MEPETLEDHLRRLTRRGTAKLDEDRALALARDLLRELASAHAESPVRHPSLDPAQVRMDAAVPRLGPSVTGAGDVSEDLFQVGALVTSAALGVAPELAWRLDPAPRPELSSVQRRALFAGLVAPRRTDRFASAAEALAAAEAAMAAPGTAPAPWPMFRGGTDRSGSRPGAPPRTLAPLWHARIGAVVASPISAAGVVIAVTADGRVAFLDPASGRVLETAPLGAAVESSPAVGGEALYVGTDDGVLVALGLADGRERGRARLGQMIRSSPLADGVVVAGTIDAKGQGALIARGPDLAPRWSRKLAPVFSSPAAAGPLAVVGADDGAVHAFETATGAPRWSQKVGSKVRATPAVAGDTIFAAALDGTVVALAAADGARRWEQVVGHAVYSSPCLAAGAVVFGCHEGHVHGLDAGTGAVRFETATRGPVLASPAARGASTLVASTDGHLYLLDEGGAVVQRLLLPGGATQSSVALDGDAAYVGGADGVHALAVRA